MYRVIFAATAIYAVPVFATGLSFWESSATNTALAAANGAKAYDASVLALAPSSITQLDSANLNVNATYYSVISYYQIFGKQSQYEKANPIPTLFASMPIRDNWFAGIGVYSRNAADISIPQIGSDRFPLFYETRVSPIVISAAPTLAYRWGNLSTAVTVEYLYAQYELEQNRVSFGEDNPKHWQGSESGWSASLSATWQIHSMVSLAVKHQFASQFDNADVAFDLPAYTSGFVTLEPLEQWSIHLSYAQTRWLGKGVFYSEYSDPFGLLVGMQDSQRWALSTRYQWRDWAFMLGASQDEAIDSLGGSDRRYRAGISYQLTSDWQLTASYMLEDYAGKAYRSGTTELVTVQNSGEALAVGVSYRF